MRHPLLAQLQSVRQRPSAQYLANGVGQAGHLPQSGGNTVDSLRVERQPVEHRVGCAGGFGGGQILLVGLEHVAGVAQYVVGRGMQRGILGRGAERRQFSGRDAGPTGGVVDLLAQVEMRWCLHTH